jgi:UDP-N-acetylglucosamine pyrophosphorylase
MQFMDKPAELFDEFEAKMRTAGVKDAPRRAFRHNFERLQAGDTGLIPERTIETVRQLPSLEQIRKETRSDPRLLSQVVMVKLNGGLGTSMGLERAKSLLPVKDGLTFLDFIARQVLHLRKQYQVPLRFVLMNSYSTSADTLEALKKYPELGTAADLELMQSQAPKVDARTRRPVNWPSNPHLEWCPPGHGDIYPSMLGSGLLEQWLDQGCKYLFVSNSDNLGASLDRDVLTHFAGSGSPFMMEVAARTPSDSKGGHLARRGGRLLLRESAQCPKEDFSHFQDIEKHRYFNTNNLWLRLDSLRQLLEDSGGFVPLPLIKNEKSVDPRDRASTPVFQLETAMGAAIQCFEKSTALLVPRERFAPVKTTSDLLALRSDAYELTEDWRIVLAGTGKPPTIHLDPDHFKLVDQLERAVANGVPSLKDCQELAVQGAVRLSSANRFRGKVTIKNRSPEPRQLPAGEYVDCTYEL